MSVRKIVCIDGKKISYLENNPDQSDTLVLIHGNSMEATLFEPVLNHPLLKNYRLLAPDLPGHGKSYRADDPKKEYRLANLIQTITDFIHELNIGRTVLLAHSLGGHLSIQATPLLKKELKGLVIFGTPPLSALADLSIAFHPHPAAQFAFIGDLTKEQMSAFVEVLGNGKFADVLTKTIRNTDRNVREVIAHDIASGQYPNEYELLKDPGIELLIIQGEQDQLINPDYLDNLRFLKLYSGKIHRIPAASHMSFMDNPDVFTELVLNYLNVL